MTDSSVSGRSMSGAAMSSDSVSSGATSGGSARVCGEPLADARVPAAGAPS